MIIHFDKISGSILGTYPMPAIRTVWKTSISLEVLQFKKYTWKYFSLLITSEYLHIQSYYNFQKNCMWKISFENILVKVHSTDYFSKHGW